MGARLKGYVHVVELDDKGQQTGRSGAFGPGVDLPEWAVNAISNDDVWDGDPPKRAAPPAALAPDDEIARLRARVAELEAREIRQPASPSAEPPRSGAGSGRDVWAAYAEKVKVEVPEGASRDDIIAAVDKAKATQ